MVGTEPALAGYAESVNATLTDIFAALKTFRADWMARGWSWDRRFECAASTFDLSEVAEAERLVEEAFPFQYRERTIARAPELVGEVARFTEGVRKDQRLYARGDESILAYGLWWPWGGEVTNISMRIGLAGDVRGEHVFELQKLFGALD